MLRRYRRFILATFVGLAAGLAIVVVRSAALYSYREFYEPAEQQYPAEQYQPARDATKPAATKQQPAAKAYDPHCDQPQSHDDADLCAQWGAVQAVSEANRLTRAALKLGYVGFWIAVLGGLFGAIGTAFLVMTFRENRRAADAAHDANRPWIDPRIEAGLPFQIDKDGANFYAVITHANKGNSPAIRVAEVAVLGAERGVGAFPVGANVARAVHETLDDWKSNEDHAGITVFPGDPPIPRRYHAKMAAKDIAAVRGDPPSDDITFVIGVGARYKFGSRKARTVAVYALQFDKDVVLNLAGETLVEQENFRLIPTYIGEAT